jgi:RmlD substrate binding domain
LRTLDSRRAPDCLIKELAKFFNDTQIAILVTGATGTVGSEIVRQLSEKEIEAYAACRSSDRIAKISTYSGVKIVIGFDFEIFVYVEPKAERRLDNFEYWKSGFIRICLTGPNTEELCRKISESGGKQRTKIWDIVPGKGYKIAFCEDPFGNIIEIVDHSYEQTITSL